MKHTKQDDWEITRYDGETFSKERAELAEEFPLTVVLNGEEFATMICSPTHMHELIVGFLASEGVIRRFDEISSVHIDEDQGFAYVEVDRPLLIEDHSKRFIGSCCGKSRQFYFKSDVRTAKTVRSKLTVQVKKSMELMRHMQEESEQFLKTGAVHNAALCTPEELLFIRTDIGRHNALDKIYGHVLENKISLTDKLIVFSGRVSSEVLLKISKIGVGILISKSAPTSLALELANDLGITVVGFARGNKLNIYTHGERIVGV
ncbi:formate dehydrogenase accessory sulfurtransferase FdhD [Virgibacillus kimchii]